MLIVQASKKIVKRLYPYKGFNENVGYFALIICDGKLVCGKIFLNYPDSQEVKIITNFGEFMVKDSDIIGVVHYDISDCDSIDIMETDCDTVKKGILYE